MRNTEGALRTPEGLRLFYRRWESPKPRMVCFLVHGLGEHGGRYGEVAEVLASRGFSVWAMDHRGHGFSEGRRSDCRSIEEFVDDLHQLVEEVRASMPHVPRVLIGHSLGGLIALTCAVRHPRSIHAVAVSAPALKLAEEPSRLKVLLVHLLARFLPTASIPNGIDPNVLSRDPQIVSDYKIDPLINRSLTARCALVLQQAMARSRDLAKQIRLPCLILQGSGDRICDPVAAAEFAQEAASSSVTFQRYEGLYHELFNEPERAAVLSDLCAWMEESIKP